MNASRRLHKQRNWAQQKKRSVHKGWAKYESDSKKRWADYGFDNYSPYYDRKGQPLTLKRYAHLEHNRKYKQLSHAVTKGRHFVSTIWLGVDHGWGMGGKPIIFETMVFCEHEDCALDLKQWRYNTEKTARKGHNVMLHRVRQFEKQS